MSSKFLGRDAEGVGYSLADASWDCDWYWGYGYIKSRNSHQHADSEYKDDNNEYGDNNIFTGKFLATKSFTEAEGWKLRELMATFYQLKKQAELLGRGGMHITSNPMADYLINKGEAERINKLVLPKLFEEVNKILDKGEK